MVDHAGLGADQASIGRVGLALGQRGRVGAVGHHLGGAAGTQGDLADLPGVAAAGLQEDRAVGLHGGVGRHPPFLVDRQAGDRDVAAVGAHVAGRAHEVGQVQPGPVLHGRDFDNEAAQCDVGGVVVDRQVGLAARGQHDLAIGRADEAAVLVDARREQHDRAAGGRHELRCGGVGRAEAAQTDVAVAGAARDVRQGVALVVITARKRGCGQATAGE